MKIICRSYVLFFILTAVYCSDNVGGKLGKYTVPVESIILNKNITSILSGNEEKLFATFSPSDASNQSVSWYSSDDTIATVDNNGVIKGRNPGSAEVKAVSSEGNHTAVCKVTVSSEKTAISKVLLNKTRLTIHESESEILFASILPSNATSQALDWKSSDTSVAEVTAGGVVTAKATGTATVTVKTVDGNHVASCDVSVSPSETNPANPIAVTGISLHRTSLSLALGKTDCLVASVLPLNASNQKIIWASDHPEIVEVSANGALTAKSAGFAIITVRSAEGSFSKQCEVSVGGSSVFTRTDSGSSTAFITPGNVTYKMIVTPELDGKQFPTGEHDNEMFQKTVPESLLIAETETTYALWKEVYDWATDYSRGDDRYVFSRKGMNGDDYNEKETSYDFPVTDITWRDAIVWCNALTEYYNAHRGSAEIIDFVYFSDPDYKIPIRNAYDANYAKTVNRTSGSFDSPYVHTTARGFRLPRHIEWEFAARYIGPDLPVNRNILRVDGIFYTNGLSASGAKAERTDTLASSLVAVIWSDVSSHIYSNYVGKVKTKQPNSLGLYDMSGNVYEHCFDWHSATSDARVILGGSTLSTQSQPFIGLAVGNEGCFSPFNYTPFVGFRLARNR